jgi:hypothetical protein
METDDLPLLADKQDVLMQNLLCSIEDELNIHHYEFCTNSDLILSF